MKKLAATQAKNNFGATMDAALAEPVLVEKSGRPSVVMLSLAEYDRLIALEDAYWANRASRAEAGGWASADEVNALIKGAPGA
jgi:antitoxin Phd